MQLSRGDIKEIELKDLPRGFFDPPKPTTQPAESRASADVTPLDAESQALVDRLRGEVAALRKDLADDQRQLSVTPKTTRKVIQLQNPDGSPSENFGSRWQPTNALAYDETNPDYSDLMEKIREKREAIASKNQEIADIVSTPSKRAAAVDASKAETEERALVLAELKRGFGDPTAVADEVVAVLLESKAIEDPTKTVGDEPVPQEKALLYKAMILNMRTAAEDRSFVAAAKPYIGFRAVSYSFRFVTEAGLIRVNRGYVLVCNIDGVWWPLQANVDGIAPTWQSYEHPLATPALWQRIAENCKELAQSDKALRIVGLKSSVTVGTSTTPPDAPN
jgi:hypothetical protein